MKVQGHRGSKATHPENTIAAFEEAYRGGADGVELDLQMTKDGELVIFHDFHKDGRLISECKAAELNATLFSEFCERLQGWEMRANLEIKWHREYERDLVPTKVFEMVREYGVQGSVYYSSFDYDTLRLIKELDPEATVGFLIDEENFAPKRLDVEILSPHFRLLTRENVREMHEMGYSVATWTVNEEADWQRLIDYGVDEIMTDSPRKLSAFVQKSTS